MKLVIKAAQLELSFESNGQVGPGAEYMQPAGPNVTVPKLARPSRLPARQRAERPPLSHGRVPAKRKIEGGGQKSVANGSRNGRLGRREIIREYLKSHCEATCREIAEHDGCTTTNVAQMMKKMLAAGEVQNHKKNYYRLDPDFEA